MGNSAPTYRGESVPLPDFRWKTIRIKSTNRKTDKTQGMRFDANRRATSARCIKSCMARAPRKNARVILLLFLLGSVFLRSNAHNKYCVGLRRDWYGAEIIARRLLYTYNRGFHVYRCLQAQAAFQGIFFGEEGGSRFSGFLCGCHCPRRLFHLLLYRYKRVATR